MIELFQKPQESSLKRTTNFQNLCSQADDLATHLRKKQRKYRAQQPSRSQVNIKSCGQGT